MEIFRVQNKARRDQIGELIAKDAREHFAQELEEPSADDRPDQRANAADDVEYDGIARGDEIDEIGRGEFVLHRVEHAGEPRENPRQHHRDDLVALHRIADGAGARLVLEIGRAHV